MIIIPSNCAAAIPSDPYWNSVSLLVKDLGINGATNNSFYDDGPYKFLPTRNGDVTQGSFSPFSGTVGNAPPQIGGSVWFDGSGDYLSLPTSNGLAFGTGDFTVEFWVFPSSYSAQVWFGSPGNGDRSGIAIGTRTTGGLWWLFGNGSAWVFERDAANTGLTLNTWNHIAITRTGGTARLFCNGKLVDSIADTTNLGQGTYWQIGQYTTGYNLTGNISNFRVVKGNALYTAAFTPPTSPLTAVSGTSLLTCQSPTAISDASSNAISITKFGDARAVSDSPFGYGSVYFDGTGDGLKFSDNAAFGFGIGDYTVEFWLNMTALPGAGSKSTLLDFRPNNSGLPHTCFVSGSGLLGFFNGSSDVFSSGVSLSSNRWYHCAWSRSSGTLKIFVDGVQVYSAAHTVDYQSSRPLSIGTPAENNIEFLSGYMSNVRIVKGTGLYTSAFTPPAAPLTAISGTSLLTCQDKGSIVDASTNSFAVSRVGDAKPAGMTPFAQKAAGYWSNYFDGSGDYLQAPSTTALNFSGDFTVEAWVRLNSVSSTQMIIAGTATSAFCFRMGTSYSAGSANGLSISRAATGDYEYASYSFAVGQWYHVAAVRQSNVIKYFINGTQVTTQGSGVSSYSFPAETNVRVGASDVATENFNGSISNLRVIKGTAVYTGNFTPSAEPLTAIAGTSLLTCQDNRFRDNSSNNFTVTKTGDTSVSRLNPFGPSLPAPTVNLASAGSVYFDGTGDYLTRATGTPFDFGTGDFCIEGWINPTYVTGTDRVIWDSRISPSDSGGGIFIDTNGKLSTYYSGAIRVTSTSTLSAGAWTHFALVRASGTMSLYVNGVSESQRSFTSAVTNPGPILIGIRQDYAQPFTGYISNFRVVKGSPVYTGAFTPSTSPLTAISGTSLLTAQDAVTVTDASSNNFTVTKVGDAKAVEATPFKRVSTVYGGSGYFDGSGDYLLIPSNSAWSFGTGDYCIEMWVNPRSWPHTTYAPFVRTVGGTQGFVICNNGGNLVYHIPNAGDKLSASLPTLGVWTHLVVCRRGTTLSMFYNGVRVATASNSNDQAASNLAIGGSTDWNTYVNSYISNFRIVKGSSVYDPSALSFTPPTAPVEPVGGTSLLLNFDNAGIYDGSGNVDLTTPGISYSSTAQTKFGGSSQYLSSANGLSSITSPKSVGMGSGNFTIEMWIYPTQLSGTQFLFDYRNTGPSSGFLLLESNLTNLRYGDNFIAGNPNISLNTWNHIALTRNSGVSKLFCNGIQVGSNYSDTFVYTHPASPVWGNAIGGSEVFSGYMDDIRVTNGIARYTANFTPPTLEAATRMPV